MATADNARATGKSSMSGSQAECVGGCTQYRFNTQNDCCRIRWLAGCFKPHALAMLDNWQAKDAKILGQAKAIERRKVIVKMAKSLNKAGENE